MKKIFILPVLFILAKNITAQNVGIGTSTPNANAALEIKSNSKGVLMPRLSTTARNNIANVAKGMLVYDTTSSGFYYHDGGKWLPISQSNIDSLLRYTYPGVEPTISSMPFNNILVTTNLYGILYDNGGLAGNYISNSQDRFAIDPVYGNLTILIKVEVAEMNIESPYDSLEIYSEGDYEHKQLFTGNRTGTFYFRGDQRLYFEFRSNGINNLSGFKINWTKITANAQKVEDPPLIGWYFNTEKMAARIGINNNNLWATENLGNHSFAFGQNAVAKGEYSFALGLNSSALEHSSIAVGSGNTVTKVISTAIGVQNIVSGSRATALGVFNDVRGEYSTALGVGLIAKEDNSIIMGRYNDTTATNQLFSIGNGLTVSNTRSNAFTILKNGNTGIGTTIPSSKLDVNGSLNVDGGIKTKYSGSAILNVTGTGSAALVYIPITTLPAGWDFTNTLVLVSLADGVSGVIYRTKLVTTSAIELFFEANATGPTRFNYIVFKL